MPSAVVDGNDLWAVRDAAASAVQRARGGDGPTLLECQTYRHYGHSKGDPAPYRPKDEVRAGGSSATRSRSPAPGCSTTA